MNLSCDEALGEVVAPCCQASSNTEIVFTGSAGLPPLSSPVRLSVVKRALLTCASHLSHPGCIKNADRSAGTGDGTIFAVRRA